MNDIKKVERLLENDKIYPVTFQTLLKDSQAVLNEQLERCKNSHAEYLSTIDWSENWISWTDDIYDAYADIASKLLSKIKVEDHFKSLPKKSHGLKLQPMPLPKFDGNIREYPRFRDDFISHVVPVNPIHSNHMS